MFRTKLLIFTLVICMILPCFTSAAIADIVVDNNDVDFSTTGSWRKSENASSINGDFLAANDTCSTATWKFQVPMSGCYEVYILYPHRNAKNVPVEIAQSGGVIIGNSLRQDQCANE